MSFKLAEAYVELTNKGFNTVSGEIHRVKSQMESATGSAGSLTDSVGKAGTSLLKAAGSAGSMSSELRSLGDIVSEFKSATEGLANLSSVDTGGVTDLASGLGKASEGAGGLEGKLGGAGGKVGALVSKSGRLLGIVGMVGAAAVGVYNAVRSWSWEAFNKEVEKGLELTNRLAESHQRAADESITEANRIAAYDARRLALQEDLHTAMINHHTTQKQFREAQEAADVGWFGSFADGKWSEELKPALDEARIRAEGTKSAVQSLQNELHRLENSKLDRQSELAERLKEETIRLVRGAKALREYQLTRDGFAKEDAAKIASKEAEIAATVKEHQKQESIVETYRNQVVQLNLKAIEIEKGAEAAQRESDRLAGYSEAQQRELAIYREKNRIAEAALAVDEERKAKEGAINELFKSQVDQLRLKAVESLAGAEAAQQERDRLAGYSELQQKELAALREKAELAAKFKALQDKKVGIDSSFDKQLEQLRLKNIEIEKGAEAAQQERDRLAGYNDEQVKALANARARNAAAQKANEAAKEANKIDKQKSTSWVSLSALAEQNQKLVAKREAEKNVADGKEKGLGVEVAAVGKAGQIEADGRQVANNAAAADIPNKATGVQLLADRGSTMAAQAIDAKAFMDGQIRMAANLARLVEVATGPGIKIVSQSRPSSVPAASVQFGVTGR